MVVYNSYICMYVQLSGPLRSSNNRVSSTVFILSDFLSLILSMWCDSCTNIQMHTHTYIKKMFQVDVRINAFYFEVIHWVLPCGGCVSNNKQHIIVVIACRVITTS